MAQDAPLTYEERQLAIFILGPWLIGCFVDLLLQGILFGQFNGYLNSCSHDKMGTRLSVIGLAIITTLKSAHTFGSTWILLILHFKDLYGAIALNYTAWWLSGSGLMVASIGIYVQTFFCYRLWILSNKKRWFVVPIIIILIFAYISVCLATYYISEGASAGPRIATWFAAHLGSVFAGDLSITIGTAYFLLKSKKEALPRTASIIDRLVRLTFQTAAPAALCAMLNLVFSQIYSGSNKLISTAFNQALAKLYAFSMMWTLNARAELWRNMNQSTQRSEGSSARRHDVLSLGSSTPGKTVLDVRRMFHNTTDHSMSNDASELKMAV